MSLFANHPLRQPRLYLPLAAALLLINLPFLHWALRGAAPVIAAVPYSDTFERASLGDQWWSNGGAWRIVSGELYSPGVGNNPLWLKARLPKDVRISFDVRGEGPDGDIKWEAFGDGRNHSTGYVFLFGGWHNRESRICKLDEHALTEKQLRDSLAAEAHPYVASSGPGSWLSAWSARRDLERLEKGQYYSTETPFVVVRPDLKVEKGKRYHVELTKRGGDLRWELDGVLVLELRDPAPLSGKGHDRFGFSSWQNDTYFDNLKIEPL
jgi:hypothetical protein